MKCPRCSTSLTKLDADEGIVVHWCQGCSGTWHDKGILDEFHRQPFLVQLLQEKPVSSQYPSELKCPRCEVLMEKSGLGALKFVVGRCRSCQGLWLDHGELAKLSQVAEAEPQPAMTCPKCQAVLEEGAVPGGVVAGVCRHCSGGWYDKCELLFLLRRVPELKVLLDRPLPQRKLSKARCPKPWCQGLLEEGSLGPGKLRVGRCSTCEGIWLDPAEKAKLDEVVGRWRPSAGRSAGAADGLVVYLSRTKLVFLALVALIPVVLGACGLLFTMEWWGVVRTATARVLGVLLITLAGSGLLWALYRLCWWRPALIVNREGIIDNTSLFGAGMMKWAEIAKVLIQESQDHAEVILWIPQKNPKARLIGIQIPQSTLPRSPGAFVLEMRRYCPDTVQIYWKPGMLPPSRAGVTRHMAEKA